MRKMITLFATLALILALFTTPALAASNTTVVFTIGSPTYTVNGQAQTMDVAPYIDSNGRTQVPVRYLAEAIGVSDSNIVWNPLLRMVTLAMNGTTVRMVIGVPVITVGLDPQTMDTSPQIIPPGRTMLPARFVAQAFGYQVTWNASAQTVTITNVTQPVGQIGTAPFASALKNLTVTVGSTTATGTDQNGNTVTVILPAAPVLVMPNTTDTQWYVQHYPAAYNAGDTITNPVVPHGDIYVPVQSVLTAFDVPSANVTWDGSKLTIYNAPNWSSIINANSTLVTNGQGGGTANLQNPLLVIDGVPMMGQTDLSGFMWNIYHTSLLKGGEDNQSGADMYHGTVLFTYYPQ